jgi:uncharacterized damage-inducible protein DinB
MTLQEIKILTAFNSWATERVFRAVEALPPGEVTRDMKSSHRTVHGTLTHLVGAEKLWLSRMLGTSEGTMLKGKEVPTIADVRK